MRIPLRTVGRKILYRESGKDKENKGVKVTDNGKGRRRGRDRKKENDREVAAPVSYLYSALPVSHSRNSVSRTINTLLSLCLSRCALPFASVRLTVMESFGLMDASGAGFYLLLPLYRCLHSLTIEMSVCTFSIACEHDDRGYDQCKCTIWHSELEAQRAR